LKEGDIKQEKTMIEEMKTFLGRAKEVKTKFNEQLKRPKVGKI